MTMRQFRALKDFHAPEFRSDYVTGLTYTIRDGNDKLATAAEAWAADGRIAFLDSSVTASSATVVGIGTVK
jgi:hypothetical protein